MKTTQELKELLYKNKTVADQQPDAIAEANAFCEGYKAFLNAAKTEREAAAYSEQLLKQAGYKPFVPGMALDTSYQLFTVGDMAIGSAPFRLLCGMGSRLDNVKKVWHHD